MTFDPPTTALIPVNKNKQALVSWKKFQKKLPSNEEMESWKSKYNGKIAGWAMPCGVVSGIVTLDFDGETGVKTMNNIGLNPNIKTPGNGYHVWIKSPGYALRTGTMDKRWPGMELKGDGGYVLVIGHNIVSKHDDEQIIGDYEILSDEPITLKQLPEDLREFVAAPKDLHQETEIIRSIREALQFTIDGRNDAGFWLACQLRDLGLNKSETLSFVLNEFLPQVPQEGHSYTPEEATKSVNSAYSRAARQPAKDKTNQTDVAVNLFINNQHELWHFTNDGYVTVPDRSNYAINSKEMDDYLAQLYYTTQATAINRKLGQETKDTLNAIAIATGREYDVEIRIAWANDACYVDTGKVYYEITGNGYRVIDSPPVKFIRKPTMGILPEPFKSQSNGWDLLRKYVNIENEDWPLIKACVLATFMPRGAYPILALTGDHGSGKSTTLSAITQCVDPRVNVDSVREAMPRDRRNLSIIASHNKVLSFDNENHITKDISDALAMLSTGGQLRTRQLYSDDSLKVFTGRRMIIVNSIGDIVTESDLLDRSIILECPKIKSFILDSKFWMEFDRDTPAIVAAIFDSVSEGISRFNSTVSPQGFRMTDFAHWSMACGIENFVPAYTRVLMKGPTISIDSSFIGSYIKRLVHQTLKESRREKVEAMALQLDKPELSDSVFLGTFDMLFESGMGETEWYKSTMGLINAYKRIRDSLEKVGIKINEFEHDSTNYIAIKGAS